MIFVKRVSVRTSGFLCVYPCISHSPFGNSCGCLHIPLRRMSVMLTCSIPLVTSCALFEESFPANPSLVYRSLPLEMLTGPSRDVRMATPDTSRIPYDLTSELVHFPRETPCPQPSNSTPLPHSLLTIYNSDRIS